MCTLSLSCMFCSQSTTPRPCTLVSISVYIYLQQTKKRCVYPVREPEFIIVFHWSLNLHIDPSYPLRSKSLSVTDHGWGRYSATAIVSYQEAANIRLAQQLKTAEYWVWLVCMVIRALTLLLNTVYSGKFVRLKSFAIWFSRNAY